jgi:Holliday junction resolvase RusA-like endonuclease
MIIISLDILGNPVPQGRPRFARVGKFSRAYDPKESGEWKDNIRAQAIAYINRQYPKWELLKGPLVLQCVFRLTRPASVSEKKRPHPIVKPDLDNLLKSVKDAMKGILWIDDSQVVEIKAAKVYASRPGVRIDLLEKAGAK